MAKQLKPKQTILIYSVFFSILFFILLFILSQNKIFIFNKEQIPNTIITTSGIFIGFIISSLGIYYSIPLRPEIKKALQEQGYYSQVSKYFVISLVSFFFSALICVIELCWSNIDILLLTNLFNDFIVSFFIFGMMLSILNSINFFKIIKAN